MSASLWDWSLASADGLLTNEECDMLLDADIFDTNDDLLKTLPPSAAKIEGNLDVFSQDHDSSTLYPPSPPETKPNRAQLADDLLHQLDNQCKQENIFSNWLEEKVDLPIFESVPAPTATSAAHTEELLREFESVYGAVELTHLTPPQSPPGPATQLLLSYAQQAQWAAPEAPLDVERLVNERAAQLTSPSPSSPASSFSSQSSSPRSSDRDDWSPRIRPTDDRRSRKKEQNKNAATRYRQKKRAEVEILQQEENSLRQRHSELGNKCSDLQREIRYLKGLMRDLFKAKGLIK